MSYLFRAQDVPPPDVSPTFDISEIPQVTIQNIGADPGWFTQPVATLLAGICAGLLAAGSAFLAYRGVMDQIASTDSRSTAERRLDALAESLTAFQASNISALKYIAAPASQSYVEMALELSPCRTAEAKLALLGLDDAADALAAAILLIASLPSKDLTTIEAQDKVAAKLTVAADRVHSTHKSAVLNPANTRRNAKRVETR